MTLCIRKYPREHGEQCRGSSHVESLFFFWDQVHVYTVCTRVNLGLFALLLYK